jgi:tetratricopeptide (TPR) repeat protein
MLYFVCGMFYFVRVILIINLPHTTYKIQLITLSLCFRTLKKTTLCTFVKSLCVLCGLMKTFTRNKWLIIILVLLFSGNTFAQLSISDSTLLQISKETNDTVKIKLMLRYVMFFASSQDFKKWYPEIHALSLKSNYRHGLMFDRFYESTLLSDIGKYDEAIIKCISCIDGLDSLGVIQTAGYPLDRIGSLFGLAGRQVEKFRYYTDKTVYYKTHGPIENVANCYHNMGGYYEHFADYDKAIGYYIRARDMYNTFDPWGAQNNGENIGEMYMKWGNLEKAEEYLTASLQNLIRWNELANTNCNDLIGDIYFMRQEYSKALEYYYEEKKHCKVPTFQASNMIRIAAVHLQLGSVDSARYYLEGAEKIRQKEKSGVFFANNFLDIDYYFYRYYIKTGDEKLAIKCLETALQQAQSAKSIPLILKYTEEFYTHLLQKGDSIHALRYLAQYQAIQDSLNIVSTQARIASYEIEQQAKAKENEIERLQTQKTTQRNYYLVGGAFLLLIVAGVISRIRYKRKRDKEQLTTEFKKQLAKAETIALRAQMNPHFIFNCLNSINSYVIDQKHETASDYLIKFSKLIRLILDNSRSETISLDKELETLKLYVLLESSRFDNKFACVYTIAEDVNTSAIMIPPMLLQPFVENAIWHGLMQKEGQGTIIIDIKKADEEFLNISIIDDGIGREKAAELKSKTATHKSHGLKVTSQRIDMMNKLNSTGAQVHIYDLKDDQGNATGTKVELIIPI